MRWLSGVFWGAIEMVISKRKKESWWLSERTSGT